MRVYKVCKFGAGLYTCTVQFMIVPVVEVSTVTTGWVSFHIWSCLCSQYEVESSACGSLEFSSLQGGGFVYSMNTLCSYNYL